MSFPLENVKKNTTKSQLSVAERLRIDKLKLQSHLTHNLKKIMIKLLETGWYADMILVSQQDMRHFKAHKFLLQSRAPAFYRRLKPVNDVINLISNVSLSSNSNENNLATYLVPEINGETLNFYLRCIYAEDDLPSVITSDNNDQDDDQDPSGPSSNNGKFGQDPEQPMNEDKNEKQIDQSNSSDELTPRPQENIQNSSQHNNDSCLNFKEILMDSIESQTLSLAETFTLEPSNDDRLHNTEQSNFNISLTTSAGDELSSVYQQQQQQQHQQQDKDLHNNNHCETYRKNFDDNTSDCYSKFINLSDVCNPAEIDSHVVHDQPGQQQQMNNNQKIFNMFVDLKENRMILDDDDDDDDDVMNQFDSNQTKYTTINGDCVQHSTTMPVISSSVVKLNEHFQTILSSSTPQTTPPKISNNNNNDNDQDDVIYQSQITTIHVPRKRWSLAGSMTSSLGDLSGHVTCCEGCLIDMGYMQKDDLIKTKQNLHNQCCSKLGQDLLDILTNDDDGVCDLIIKTANGIQLKAHRPILAATFHHDPNVTAAVDDSQHVDQRLSSCLQIFEQFNDSIVRFALKFFYSGCVSLPEQVDVWQLLKLANLLNCHDLKRVVILHFKANLFHYFHKPCPSCSSNIMENIENLQKFQPDFKDLLTKCLRWQAKYFVRIWKSKMFQNLSQETFKLCLDSLMDMADPDNIWDILLGYEKLDSSTNSKKPNVLAQILSDLYERCLDFLSSNFSTALTSPNFHNLGKGYALYLGVIEQTLPCSLRKMHADEACRTFVILKNLPSQLCLQNHHDFNERFVNLLKKLLEMCQKYLINRADQVVVCQNWILLDDEMQRKIKDDGIFVDIQGPTAPRPKISSLSRNSTNKRASYSADRLHSYHQTHNNNNNHKSWSSARNQSPLVTSNSGGGGCDQKIEKKILNSSVNNLKNSTTTENHNVKKTVQNHQALTKSKTCRVSSMTNNQNRKSTVKIIVQKSNAVSSIDYNQKR